MTLPLTPETLRAAYDYLATTPPFNKWNLPDGEDVAFRVVRSTADQGWYTREGKKHVIGISSRLVGHTISLIGVMSHEMIHLHMAHSCVGPWDKHTAAFKKMGERVCKIHGFDPKYF